jgi:hypothetical protein
MFSPVQLRHFKQRPRRARQYLAFRHLYGSITAAIAAPAQTP